MSKVIELENKADFDSLIKEGVSLVDFFATWCAPCQMMKPIFAKLSEEMNGVKMMSVDVDKFSDIAAKYEVMSIPTFIIFKDGEAKEVKFGAMSEIDLKKWLEKNK